MIGWFLFVLFMILKLLVGGPPEPQKLIGLLRDLYLHLCDSRVVTWIHARSHGCERDAEKQLLFHLNERAGWLSERGRCGDPCFVLHSL